MFWTPPKPGPGVAVDPAKEAQRLRANAALGQNADKGDADHPGTQELLDRLF